MKAEATKERIGRSPILRILLIGFAALLILVAFLGQFSISHIESIRAEISNLEKQYASYLESTFDLRKALDQAYFEARASAIARSARIDAPPFKNNPKRAKDNLLDQMNTLGQGSIGQRLTSTDEWNRLKTDITDFLVAVDNPEIYELQGSDLYNRAFSSFQDYLKRVIAEHDRIANYSKQLQAEAQKVIASFTFICVILGAAVAGLAIYGIRQRLIELARSHRAVYEAREFTRNILNGMVDALFTLDSEGNITSTNESFNRLLGRSKEDIIGAHYSDLLNGNSKLAALIGEALSVAEPQNRYSGRVELADKRRFDVFSSPFIADGAKNGLIVSLIDVTEVERAQEELRRRRELAKIGQMTAQVAHEIKNPLGGIKLNLSYLKRKFAADAEAVEIADEIAAGIDRLNLTVSELNQFARQRDLQLQPVDLNKLLDQQLALVADRIQQKRIEIIKDYQEDLPSGMFDPNELGKVFINFLINSIEACELRTAITVSTATDNSNHLVVKIIDEGCGMSEETLEKLFEPFYTTKPTGTGLGMAIAKKIIDQHNGSVEVRSAPGVGTEVTVYLPLVEEPQPIQEASVALVSQKHSTFDV